MAKTKEPKKIWTNKNRIFSNLFRFLKRHKEFVFFDTETTGLTSHDKIIQLSGIKVIAHWEETDRFNTYINPAPNILLPKITEITGITVDDVKDAPLESEVIPVFTEWSKDAGFFAYNSSFDANMYAHALERLHITREIDHFDVLEAARTMCPGLEIYKLATVAEYLDVIPEDANFHDSMFDVEMTLAVMKKVLKMYRESPKEDNGDKIRPKVFALNPWSKGKNQRLYIPTSAGSVYYDKIGKYFGAGTADKPLDIDTLDMNYVEAQCIKIAVTNGFDKLSQVNEPLHA